MLQGIDPGLPKAHKCPLLQSRHFTHCENRVVFFAPKTVSVH